LLLQNIDITIKNGEHIAITGNTGTGKSLLTLLLTNNLECNYYAKNGDIAYIEQSPFIGSGSIVEFIVQGNKFNENKLKMVIEKVLMSEDIGRLPLKENTIIGTRGCNLSKGQIARLALASALYSDKDIYVIDDIFSNLNLKVADDVFDLAIVDYLKNKTVILVSCNSAILNKFQKILIVSNNTIEMTTPNNVQLPEINNIQPVDQISINDQCAKAQDENEMSTDENSIFEVFKHLFIFKGSTVVLLIVLGFVLTEVIMNKFIFENSNSPSFQMLSYVICSILLLLLYATFNLQINNKQHDYSAVLYRGMINSLSESSCIIQPTKSIGSYKTLLENNFDSIAILFNSYFAINCATIMKIIVISLQFSTQSILHLLMPLLLIFICYKYSKKCVNSLNVINRRTNISCEHVNNFIVNVYSNARALWAACSENQIYKENATIANNFTHIQHDGYSAKIALNFYLYSVFLLWKFLILALGVTTQYFTAGLTAVGIRAVSKISDFITAMLESYVGISSTLNSYRRCKTILELPKDLYKITQLSSFDIAFENATMGYQNNKVISSVNLKIPFGSSLAIIGRTGSGKTTLCLSLLRMSKLFDGSLTIGGQCINDIEPRVIRDYVHYLPQDLSLYEGTIYSNIVPFTHITMEQTKAKLTECGLWAFMEKQGLNLDRKISDESKEVSEGEKQIILICRAFMSVVL
jgi:ATP-binding cassette subfamily C (CFTR/MRP) protein 10